MTAAVPQDPPDLARRHLWSRFPTDTEAVYQHWAIGQTLTLNSLLAVTSFVLWLFLPLFSWAILGTAPPSGLLVLSVFVNAPLVAVWLALLRWPRTRPRYALWTFLAQLVIGCISMFGFRHLFGSSTAAAALVAILFSMLSPFARMPLRLSLVSASILLAAAAVVTGIDVHDTDLTQVQALPSYAFLFAVLLLVVGATLFGEDILRRSFVQEQIIARNRQLIRRYVPPSVAAQIETGHATDVDTPVRRRVTILFSDVVGFTTMADRLDAESLTQVINEYLGMVSDVVESFGGTLNEFAGDGFMAVFGAPAEMDPEDQVFAAIQAARDIHAHLPDLNERWFRLGIDQPVRTRIGINTGVLSVGTFGSEGRATYTAIGLQTNIAARIEAQCEPGGILLSQSSWHLAKDRVACEPRGEVTVKGVHFPIELYEPVGT